MVLIVQPSTHLTHPTIQHPTVVWCVFKLTENWPYEIENLWKRLNLTEIYWFRIIIIIIAAPVHLIEIQFQRVEAKKKYMQFLSISVLQIQLPVFTVFDGSKSWNVHVNCVRTLIMQMFLSLKQCIKHWNYNDTFHVSKLISLKWSLIIWLHVLTQWPFAGRSKCAFYSGFIILLHNNCIIITHKWSNGRMFHW